MNSTQTRNDLWFWIRIVIAFIISANLLKETWVNAHGNFFLEGLFIEISLGLSLGLLLLILIIDRKRYWVKIINHKTLLVIALLLLNLFSVYYYAHADDDYGTPILTVHCSNCLLGNESIYFYENNSLIYEIREEGWFADEYQYHGHYEGNLNESGLIKVGMEWLAPKKLNDLVFDFEEGEFRVLESGSKFSKEFRVEKPGLETEINAD